MKENTKLRELAHEQLLTVLTLTFLFVKRITREPTWTCNVTDLQKKQLSPQRVKGS